MILPFILGFVTCLGLIAGAAYIAVYCFEPEPSEFDLWGCNE